MGILITTDTNKQRNKTMNTAQIQITPAAREKCHNAIMRSELCAIMMVTDVVTGDVSFTLPGTHRKRFLAQIDLLIDFGECDAEKILFP